MIKSAGCIVICQNKILLIKPKGLGEGHYSIPKGQIEKGETIIQAAIRETKEEIGLSLSEKDLTKYCIIDYINRGIITKRVYCYLVIIKKKSINEFNFTLQKEEVDDVNFYSLNEAKEKLFWRFHKVLNLLKE